jgi:hypothetical protein
VLAAGVCAGTALGCRATHLVYVYDLSVGVDVAYSQQGNPKLVVGYDRSTWALVPQKDAQSEDDELMSLAAVSRVRIQGLDEVDFDHFVATGGAAKDMAKDDEGLRKIREAIFGEGKPSQPPTPAPAVVSPGGTR